MKNQARHLNQSLIKKMVQGVKLPCTPHLLYVLLSLFSFHSSLFHAQNLSMFQRLFMSHLMLSRDGSHPPSQLLRLCDCCPFHDILGTKRKAERPRKHDTESKQPKIDKEKVLFYRVNYFSHDNLSMSSDHNHCLTALIEKDSKQGNRSKSKSMTLLVTAHCIWREEGHLVCANVSIIHQNIQDILSVQPS